MNVFTTLELKERNSNKTKVENGVWANSLSKPIYIEEGDSIEVHKAFIDNTNESVNSIYLKDDLTIEFNFMVYNVNINPNLKTYDPNVGPDGEIYLLCNKNTEPDHSNDNYEEAVEVGFYWRKGAYLGEWGGFTVSYSYIDIKGDKLYFNHTLPPFDARDPEAVTVPINIIVLKGSFTLISPSVADMYNKYYTQYAPPTVSPISSTIDVYSPEILQVNVNIPSGNYDPIFIAKTITDQLTENTLSLSGNFTPVQNNILFTSNDPRVLSGRFVNIEGSKSFTYTPTDILTPPMWIGTNQFSVEYDTQQRFFISQMHMPVYSESGLKIVKFIPSENNFKPVSAAGGVFIHHIRCFGTKSLLENDFFQIELGFKLGLLCPKIQSLETVLNGVESKIPTLSLIAGRNYTEGLISVDIGITKNEYYDTCPSPSGLESSIGDQTTSIYSNSIIGSARPNSTGYYQIEINSEFSNEFVSDNYTKKNISAIVNKYYTNQNYTSAGNESSIPYIHSGNPLTLKAFQIRILDANGQIADDLGDDSTILLRVIKSNKNKINK
jgi:hypothetical protein